MQVRNATGLLQLLVEVMHQVKFEIFLLKKLTLHYHTQIGQICAGDLIFEDNFDFLDFGKWEHEINADGGGVSLEILI
jgi:hypothetical protein